MHAYRSVERDWHLSVAVALLENWNVPDEIVNRWPKARIWRANRATPSLTDVLMLALTIGRNAAQPDALQASLQDCKCLARFNLTAGAIEMLAASKDELDQLEAALT